MMSSTSCALVEPKMLLSTGVLRHPNGVSRSMSIFNRLGWFQKQLPASPTAQYSASLPIPAEPVLPQSTVTRVVERALTALETGDELLAEEWLMALASVYRDNYRSLKLEGSHG